jgi:hypothetical protein
MRIQNSGFKNCHYLYNDVPGPGLVGGVDNLADKGLLLAPLVRVHNARHPLVSGSNKEKVFKIGAELTTVLGTLPIP